MTQNILNHTIAKFKYIIILDVVLNTYITVNFTI